MLIDSKYVLTSFCVFNDELMFFLEYIVFLYQHQIAHNSRDR